MRTRVRNVLVYCYTKNLIPAFPLHIHVSAILIRNRFTNDMRSVIHATNSRVCKMAKRIIRGLTPRPEKVVVVSEFKCCGDCDPDWIVNCKRTERCLEQTLKRVIHDMTGLMEGDRCARCRFLVQLRPSYRYLCMYHTVPIEKPLKVLCKHYEEDGMS